MTHRATVLGCLFLALAVALAGCEVLGVYEYVTEHKSSLYIVIGSSIIAAVTPALPALADWFLRGRQWGYGLAAWAGFLVCLSIVLTAAIQRTGSATDAGEQARVAAWRAEIVAVAAEKQAAADYAAAQAAALKECDVRGKKCMDAEDKASAARATLAKSRAALVAAPAGDQVDPLARRLAAVLRVVTEDQVRLMQPLLVPVALSILSALFFAGWARLDFETGHVRTTPDNSGQLRTKEELSDPKPSLTLAPKFGPLAAFLVNRTKSVVGQAIEVERAMYGEYQAWCASENMQPHPPAVFARQLARVGKAAGIAIEIRGKEAYCLDRRLA